MAGNEFVGMGLESYGEIRKMMVVIVYVWNEYKRFNANLLIAILWSANKPREDILPIKEITYNMAVSSHCTYYIMVLFQLNATFFNLFNTG